ncbi:MAG: histidinol-phosphate transaminase [bacterium]
MESIDAKRMMRPCVKYFEPYIPGKPISEVKKRFGLKKIIKLASNENPLGPSKKIFSAVNKILKDLYLYPVGNSQDLRQMLAKKYGLSLDEIIVGSGTDELIEIIGKTFLNPEDEIVVSKHAFIRYRMTGQLMNCKIREIPMRNFTHDLDNMLKAVNNKTKIVFIANPNNPTGTFVNKKEINIFLSRLPKKVIVCLDEAYYEYACVSKNYPDGIALYKSRGANLIVLRTFSKIYALAGLRVGYAVSRPDIIDGLDRIRPPFNVNTVAQIAAKISLEDLQQIKQGQNLVRAQKSRLYNCLDSIGVRYIPSAANFVLMNSKSLGYSGKELFNLLLKRGIIIREMSEYELPDWVRITVSKSNEMNILFNALKNIGKIKK